MGAAALIAFEEVRASKQWESLRQELPTCFDEWLDTLAQPWHTPPSTLLEVPSTRGDLRPQRTGRLPATSVAPVHRGEHARHKAACPPCDRVLPAREPVCRTVDTMVGSVQLERPSCSCRTCRAGGYPLEQV